jgi:hypothetical protein
MADYDYDFGYGDDFSYYGQDPLDFYAPEFDIDEWWSSQDQADKDIADEISAGGGGDFLKSVVGQLGDKAGDFLKKYLYDSASGKVNMAGLGTAAAALKMLTGGNDVQTGGYNKPIPKLDAVREQVQYNDPNRAPGSGGRQYFTDTRYVPQGNAEALAAAKTASAQQASGLQAAMQAAPVPAPNPYAGKMNLAYSRPGGVAPSPPRIDTTPVAEQPRSLEGQNETLEAYRRSMGPNFQPVSSGLSSALGDYLKNIGSQPAQQPRSYTPEPSSPISKDDPFYQSDEYKAFEKNSANMLGTANMYDSPYFGRLSSGSIGSAMDDAYRKYKGISSPAPGGVLASFIGGGLGNYEPGTNPKIDSLINMRNASQTTPQPRLYDAPEMMQQPEQPSGPVGSYARGGIADAGRYLQGETDGMADKIPSSIDGEQPAALSHGEFVIPADVVSHLGNGNSDAGAQKLYEMMDRIRQARTGTTEQGKEINPDEFTMGGLAAAYAGGGSVQRFNGATTSLVTAPAPATPAAPTASNSGVIPYGTSASSQLSPWAGDYVTNYLAEGAALAKQPFQAYQGPLTAGASDLQQQAFAGASEMAQTGYQPGQFTGSFTPQMAQQYMNPYLQASLDPQLKELNRQSQIARMEDAGRLTKAGAFGGSRQAIMESEGRRNLLDKQQDVLGTGYKTAYDMAQQQYAKDRGDEEASRQFGANFGMKSIDQLSGLGAVQRGITSEGIAADKAQFEEQRDFMYKMPQYQKDLLQGLPITTTATTSNTTELARIGAGLADLQKLYDNLANLGQTAPTPAPTPAPVG